MEGTNISFITHLIPHSTHPVHICCKIKNLLIPEFLDSYIEYSIFNFEDNSDTKKCNYNFEKFENLTLSLTKQTNFKIKIRTELIKNVNWEIKTILLDLPDAVLM